MKFKSESNGLILIELDGTQVSAHAAVKELAGRPREFLSRRNRAMRSVRQKLALPGC